MPNPFRSEADAYRLVWLTIGYFALIVLASWIDNWLGVAVFVALSVGALAWFFRARREAPERKPTVRRGGDDERRILVIANETVGGRELADAIHERAGKHREEVLVVCPALNSPLKHWASDEDGARSQAQQRLERSLASLREGGVNARGEIGDPDPLQAIEDACRTFGPDEIVISTHPEGRSNWLERGVVDLARQRFETPITHVVVDLDKIASGTALPPREP